MVSWLHLGTGLGAASMFSAGYHVVFTVNFQGVSMTNEQLIKEIAKAIAEEYKKAGLHDISFGHYPYLDVAQAVIDHLTPMLRKIGIALDEISDDDSLQGRIALQAFESLPECWRGGTV